MPDAIVLPGGQFGPAAGMLMYAAAVADRRSAAVHRLHWAEQQPPFGPASERWVRDQVIPVLDELGGRPLLIGKSLGTAAATVAAERGLPAVWLTPILTAPWVADALSKATAPFLLVGGTEDPMWDPEVARRLSSDVMEVEGGDHGLFVPGPLEDSIAVLARMVRTIERFLGDIDWPSN
jgi:pimeloyl-ACP methyl ester carboxylesterase